MFKKFSVVLIVGVIGTHLFADEIKLGAADQGRQQGTLGLRPTGVSQGGVKVRVINGGPAEQAGITTGDIVLAIDSEPTATVQLLYTALAGRHVGETVVVHLLSGNEVSVKLVEEFSLRFKRFEDLYSSISTARQSNLDSITLCGVTFEHYDNVKRKLSGFFEGDVVGLKNFADSTPPPQFGDLSPGDAIKEIEDYKVENLVDLLVIVNGLISDTNAEVQMTYFKRMDTTALPYTSASVFLRLSDGCLAEFREKLTWLTQPE